MSKVMGKSTLRWKGKTSFGHHLTAKFCIWPKPVMGGIEFLKIRSEINCVANWPGRENLMSSFLSSEARKSESEFASLLAFVRLEQLSPHLELLNNNQILMISDGSWEGRMWQGRLCRCHYRWRKLTRNEHGS